MPFKWIGFINKRSTKINTLVVIFTSMNPIYNAKRKGLEESLKKREKNRGNEGTNEPLE